MIPWSQKYPDGCLRCGVKRKRAHAGQGYCTRCYYRARRRGLLPPSRNESRIRVRAGERQYFCYDCGAWKSSENFDLTKQRTKCGTCRREQRRAKYAANREQINELRRAKVALEARRAREGDARIKRGVDPWRTKAIIPLDLIDPWLDQLLLENEGSWLQVSQQIGFSDRRLRVLRDREMGRRGLVTEKVTVDVAEKIARVADRMDELRDFLVPGVVGWAKDHIHCTRCGRYDIPHHGQGLCKRCYQNKQYHDKRGQPQPPPLRERWATWYHACVRCGRTKFRHQGKGVCSGCYQQVRRERRAAA